MKANWILICITILLAACAPTQTLELTEHDVTVWHAPVLGHHHGVDPEDAGMLGAFFVKMSGQEIGHSWISSPIENLFPYTNGKHEGFVNLYEEDTGCPGFNMIGNCIKSYFLQVHTLGTVATIFENRHSFALAAEVCQPDGSEPCGYVFTGGISNYGVLHNEYKTDVCELPKDPLNYPYDAEPGQHQPPYRTGHNTTNRPPQAGLNVQFWSAGLNPRMHEYYPDLPNHIFVTTWSTLDAFQYINGDPDKCADPAEAISICPDGSCEYNGSRFQVFEMVLRNLPTERPFDGYTNLNGHIDDGCTEESAECVPLHIDKDVPTGQAVFDRQVRQGNCSIAPCQEFDPGDGSLVMPGYQE